MQKLINLYFIVFRYWMTFPEKLRFLLVGGYNTVVSYLLYVGYLWLLNGKFIQIALFLSFITSSVNSYFTQKFYVFNTPHVSFAEYARCVASWAVSYAVNAGLLYVLTRILLLNPYITQGVLALVMAVLNYILLKYFAFRAKSKKI